MIFHERVGIYSMFEKDQMLSKFTLFKVMIEKFMGVPIKTIQTDGGVNTHHESLLVFVQM